MERRRVAIIGAGISGLATCKHALDNGFQPMVFEADTAIGGVWNRTLASTILQSPKSSYQFSDFPWPEKVEVEFPDHQQVMEYLKAYAFRFDLFRHVQFGARVVGIEYEGVTEEEMAMWDCWAGNSKAFGSGKGKWTLTVQVSEKETTKRWLFSTFVESYFRWKIPMKKYGMVPEHSFFQAMSSCLISILPKDFYDRVGERSIILKNSAAFCFYENGVLLDSESTPIEADIVILATGYKSDKKLEDIFILPLFKNIVAGSQATIVPLYRQCVHPRIPQLAIIGYPESITNLFTSDILSRWLVHFLDGGFKLPSIRCMEQNILEWDKFMKNYSRDSYRRLCISTVHIWYSDQLCRDMGCNPRRKKGFLADWFLPYGPMDYLELNAKEK